MSRVSLPCARPVHANPPGLPKSRGRQGRKRRSGRKMQSLGFYAFSVYRRYPIFPEHEIENRESILKSNDLSVEKLMFSTVFFFFFFHFPQPLYKHFPPIKFEIVSIECRVRFGQALKVLHVYVNIVRVWYPWFYYQMQPKRQVYRNARVSRAAKYLEVDLHYVTSRV